MNTSALLSVSLHGAIMAINVALIIVSLSTNKLEGMAATKMAAMLTLEILPPYFIKGNAEYLFAVLPSYWLGKCAQMGGFLPLFLGLLVLGVWIVVLSRKFYKKVSI